MISVLINCLTPMTGHRKLGGKPFWGKEIATCNDMNVFFFNDRGMTCLNGISGG
jgi:hypothetical protein